MGHFLQRLFNKNGHPVKSNEREEDTARHILEFQVLPNYIEDKDKGLDVINGIMKEGGNYFIRLYNVLHNVAGEKDYVCSYRADEFIVTNEHIPKSSGNDLFITKVQMPEPESMSSCKMIMIFHNKDCSERVYYTVEKSAAGKYALCYTTEDRHMLLGLYSPNSLQELIDSWT